MRIAALTLGILGGLFGLGGAVFALGVGGVASAMQMEQAKTVVGLIFEPDVLGQGQETVDLGDLK